MEAGGGSIGVASDGTGAIYTAPLASGIYHIRFSSHVDGSLYTIVPVTVTRANTALSVHLSGPSSGAVGTALSFGASASNASGRVNFNWAWGDGNSTGFVASQSSATHTYASPGTYTVILSARDGSNQSASDTLSVTVTGSGSGAFTPNYIDQLNPPLMWKHTSGSPFHVTVYFPRDGSYTVSRHSAAVQGFNMWVQALNNRIQFQEITSPSSPDITVTFDPSTANGYTLFGRIGDIIQPDIKMTLGFQDVGLSFVQGSAAHEFGHALGINGHSTDPNDLMYVSAAPDKVFNITTRDLNTVKTIYRDLFGGRAAQIGKYYEFNANAPVRTQVIQ